MVAVAPLPANQPPQPTFRSAIDAVQVDLTVLDRGRRPIADLDPSEITILEDGKPRPILAFTRVDTAGPDVAAPALPSTGTATAGTTVPTAPAVSAAADPDHGRLVTILFDRSIPAGPPTVTAREIALSVTASLGPDDLAAVVRGSRFSGDGLSQSYTRDRERLRQAILSGFSGQIAAPDMRRVTETDPGGLEDGRPEQMYSGDCACGICTLDAIARVAAAVRDIRDRRKILVWIGSDLLVETSEIECNFRLRDERTRLFRALDLSNLTVHVVDPSGLQPRQLSAASTMRASRAGQRQAENRVEDQDRQGNLAVLPDRTGGRTIINSNAPADLVPQLMDESRVFYLVAFAPARPADGRYHKVEVKVARKGARVQARRGYMADAPAR